MTVATKRNVLSVSQVNNYIKQILSNDAILSVLWIKGEISNFKYHSSGHMYFTLKDEGAVIKSVMFKGYNSFLKFRPEDGMSVVIKGQVSVYEKDGQYQLYAEYMEPFGMGSLHIAFEQLKEELTALGYFDKDIKKPIPFLPEKICVITSPTGAVIRDILKVLDRRFQNINVCIYPVLVQGDAAAGQIARAIDNVNAKNLADVIIIARGGGSLEELWAFNERIVANAILKSNIPVISAVGHETDYTIADFVADLRAPTPSVAAEMVVPEKLALKNTLSNISGRLGIALSNLTKIKRNYLKQLTKRAVLRQPISMLYSHRLRLDSMQKMLLTYIHRDCKNNRNRFANLAGKLEALSPLAVMARGFGVIRNNEKRCIIKTIQNVENNDTIEVELVDGKFDCLVKNVHK